MSDFVISPGVKQVTHDRLRDRGNSDAHPQYSLTTHTHAAAAATLISYTTGGTRIEFGRTFAAAPVVVCSIETPSGTHPFVAYVNAVNTTGFKVVIYTGAGAETAATGAFRVFWQAIPEGG